MLQVWRRGMSRVVRSGKRLTRSQKLAQETSQLNSTIGVLRKEIDKADREGMIPPVDDATAAKDSQMLYWSLYPQTQPQLSNSERPRLPVGAWCLRQFTQKLGGLNISQVNYRLAAIPARLRGENTEDLVATMRGTGVTPNCLTYDLLIAGCAEYKDIDRAERLFQQCIASLEPTVYTYAHLLNAHSHDRELTRLKEIYADMKEREITPNVVIYTTIMAACIRTHDLTQARETFDAMRYQGIAPDVEAYTLMITACAHGGEVERAMQLFTEMQQSRRTLPLLPNASTYDAMIHACSTRKEYYAQAWRYADEMRRAGHSISRTTLELLLSACGRAGDLYRAREIMRALGDRASLHAVQHLFRAYTNFRPRIAVRQPIFSMPLFSVPLHNLDMTREAEEVWATYRSLSDTQLCNTYLAIFARYPWEDLFKSLYASIFNDTGNPRNIHTYITALEFAYKTRDLALAEMVWQDWCRDPDEGVEREEVKGHKQMVQWMVAVLSRCNQLDQAMDLLGMYKAHPWHPRDLAPLFTKSRQSKREDITRKLLRLQQG